MIDLHLHLDGSLPISCVRELAELQHLPLPANLEAELRVPSDCRDLNQYLACFQLPVSLLQSAGALRLAASALAKELRAQELSYAEVRFAPQLHTEQGLSQEGAIEAVCQGFEGYDIQTILCCMRGGTREENLLTVELAAKWLGHGVCAADLAGAEALFPTGGYGEIFRRAKALGVPFTIHAGEAAGPESIRAALDMGASRIGHGVRAVEDEALMAELAERQIPLELCFTSNLQTRAVAPAAAFPLREFLRRGIAATVNTDNMTVSGTNLRLEYERLGLTEEEKRIVEANALRAAFRRIR